MTRTLIVVARVPQPRRAGGPCGPAGRTRASPRAQGHERGGAGPVRGEERGQDVQGGARNDSSSVAGFKDKYGTNANKANAFGKCVSGHGQEGEASDEDESRRREGRGERREEVQGGARDSSASQGFKDKYGTNANKANAFGKCVSKLAKEQAPRRELTPTGSATGRRHRLRR